MGMLRVGLWKINSIMLGRVKGRVEWVNRRLEIAHSGTVINMHRNQYNNNHHSIQMNNYSYISKTTKSINKSSLRTSTKASPINTNLEKTEWIHMRTTKMSYADKRIVG
jgi:hypothetical protein